LRPWRGEVVLGCGLIVGSVTAQLAVPALVRVAVDRGARHGRVAVIDRVAVAMIAVAIVGWLCGRFQIVVVTRVGEKFLRALRVRVFDHMLGMSLGFFDDERTGRLVARMTSDIDVMSDLIQLGLVQFIQNMLLFVFTMIVLVVMSPPLAAVCLVMVPPVFVASAWFRRRSNRAYLLVRDRVSQTLSTLQEGLSGIRVVQAFTAEDTFVRRFRRHNLAQSEANMDAARVQSLYFPIVEGAGIMTTAVVVGVGALFWRHHVTTVGTIAAFALYINNLFEPMQQLSQLFNTVQSSIAGLQKIFGLLDTRSPVRERAAAVDLPERGDVELDEVSFAYGGAGPLALDAATLRVAEGERVALVGPTGAGKSTIGKLVARMYDPTDGRVRIGGVDLRDVTLESLRRHVMVVPQEGHLFTGTIADNVRLGRPDASDGEIATALASVGALERFSTFPAGLDTDVRHGGSRLSAGERQLVSLARAFLADPRVLVLDEATSSLDPGTEAEVESAVEALMAGRTVLVVAHRLSTAERADRVAVIDGGRVAEVGTHAELLARRGRYALLFRSWTGGLAAAG